MNELYNIEILQDNNLKHNIAFKVIVIGPPNCGKSSITVRATENIFREEYQGTIGFEFSSINFKIDEDIIKLQIWDTCGQDVYKSLVTNFFRSSALAVVVYSIENRESFLKIDEWLDQLRYNSHPAIKIFLIGNKSDLDEYRKVSYQEGENFKNLNKLDYFTESSAKTGYNTTEAFSKAAQILYEEYKKNQNNVNSIFNSIDTHSTASFKLNNREKYKNERKESSCNC